MSFVSIEFALLVLLTLALYYLPLLERMQVSILVLASLVFFGWDQWRLLPLLLIAIGMTYWAMVGAIQGSRIAAALGVAGNLALLGFFKYKFLFLDFPHGVSTGIPVFDFLVRLPLPIGISFFVFHNISLIVDYYKSAGDQPRPGGLQVGLYILFFPQLVSGPISRAASFLPQIKKKHILDVSWVQAAELLSAGLFFKLFVANNLAQITALMAPELNRNIGWGGQTIIVVRIQLSNLCRFFRLFDNCTGTGFAFWVPVAG